MSPTVATWSIPKSVLFRLISPSKIASFSPFSFLENPEFLKVKEQLAVSIIEIVEGNDASFAFPSQSLYVESFPKDSSEIFNPKISK